MKRFTLFAALIMPLLLAAQTDTSIISIRQENIPLEQQQYADLYQTMFRSQEPARFLFKWNALAVWPTGSDFINQSIGIFQISSQYKLLTLDFAAEGKILPWLSINTGLSVASGRFSPDLFLYSYIPKSTTQLKYRIEPRVYFDMPKRIRKGHNANNFSGNYFSLEYGSSDLLGSTDELHSLPSKEETITLRFGVQRRLFRYGYFDVSYGIGWREWRTPTISNRQEIFASSRIAVGFALAAGTSRRATTSSLCDVTRCYREENQMWRIDVANILVIENLYQLSSELPVAYERKFGSSAFSTELEGRLSYSRSNNYQNTWLASGYFQWFGAVLAAEPRWYFNLKKRIARGRSGNNLSGPFLALHTEGRFEYVPKDYVFRDQSTYSGFIAPVFGIQYRFLKNGFITYKAGFGPSWYKQGGEALFQNGVQTDVYWLSELKVGFAW